MAFVLVWQLKLGDRLLTVAEQKEEPNLVLKWGQMALSLQTIKNRSTFVKIHNKGNYFKGKYINVQFLEDSNLNGIIVVGFTATKKMGNAVKRNKAKRLMRELARKVLVKYGKINSYYVLIAKNSIFDTPFAKLEIELKKLISW